MPGVAVDASSTVAASGLTAAEAAGRLARDGPNVLPTHGGPALWRRLAHQLTHFFALMLWVASGLALVAGMPQLAVAVAVVVVVNGVFAFAQEHRAEKAAHALQDLLPRRAVVRRDGARITIDAAELVVGDLLLLAQGDRISADASLVTVLGLGVDTSLLTGESVPVRPSPGATVWSGTFVVEGEAHAVVTATGGGTRLAEIAELTQAGHRPKSPLAREIDRIVRVLSVAALSVGLTFFAVASLVGLASGTGSCSPWASPSPSSPKDFSPPSRSRWPAAPSRWRPATPSCAASKRSRPSGRPRSSVPTRPGP